MFVTTRCRSGTLLCVRRADQTKTATAITNAQPSAGVSGDGQRLEIAANIASASDALLAFQSGAEGIGLFRTEMLFMDREQPPDEEEQYQAYAAVLTAAAGKPVIIRTFDIGGDKPVAYL